MAAENPNPAGQPLFIVDRDWLRQGPKARKSWTGNVRNRSLYGLAIQATQYDVPGRAARQKSQTRLRKTDREKQIDATDSESTSEPEQVLSRATTPMRTQSEYAPDSTMTQNQKLLAVPGTNMLGCARSFDSWPENPALHPPISTNFPGLRYVRGLECYLDFYLDVIGSAQHPIETRFYLRRRPSRSSWFSRAFEEDVWSRNIALSSALHHASDQAPDGANALMSSLLSQLNERISRSDLSDDTVASVSYLTLGEHIKGNHQLAKVHASGMAEMVRLRGGLHTIERARRNKIARADLIRSVDTLEPPLLPRLSADTPALNTDLREPSVQVAAAIAKLGHTNISPRLFNKIWMMDTICSSLDRVWTGQAPLDTTACYEHVLLLNHDLLTMRCVSAIDEALRLSIINFTQPMFRYCVYTQISCQQRAQRLRHTLESLHLEQYDQDVILWILLTGYMNSEQTNERDWFKGQLRGILQQTQLSALADWNIVKARLRSFVWTDSIHDQLGKHFFDNVWSDRERAPPHLDNICLTCSGSDLYPDIQIDPFAPRNAPV